MQQNNPITCSTGVCRIESLAGSLIEFRGEVELSYFRLDVSARDDIGINVSLSDLVMVIYLVVKNMP